MNDKYTKTKGIGQMPRTSIETEVTRKVVATVSTTEVALDATNAGELVALLNATKDAIKASEAKADALKAELYTLLGYSLVNGEWVGTAEVGTVGGNVVVKVATINATKFEKDRLLSDKPELAPVFEAYTIPAPYKAMKTGK